ncbi:MAG TPA: hypothetical protein VGS16_13625 [Candidatus Dormibacteraeota bacterium]|nr:hypothetical protein [Candidatus Dormibacteraeota bacterium]
MPGQPNILVEQRNDGLQKLRDLTIASFCWALGLLAVFSVIAAVTIPGQSTTASNSATSPVTDTGQLQGPVDGSFQPAGGGGAPLVVSGGSR